MSVSRHEAVRVTDQHEIAVAFEFVAGIGDDAVVGGLDRRAFRHRQIDAVVLRAVRLGAEAGDDAALYRPAERLHGAGGLGGLGGGFRRLLRLGRRHASALRRNGRDLLARNDAGLGQLRRRQIRLTRYDRTRNRSDSGDLRRGDTRGRGLRRGLRYVARDDQTLARLDIGGVTDAVGLQQRGERHAMLARDGFGGFAMTDGDGRTAVPGPGALRRLRSGRDRTHRTGDVGLRISRLGVSRRGLLVGRRGLLVDGSRLGDRRARAVSAETRRAVRGTIAALIAVTVAGDSRRRARRRQRLGDDAAGRRGTRCDRTRDFLRWGLTAGGSRVTEASGVRTAGDRHTDQSEDGDTRQQPSRDVKTRHVVTHSYTK